MELCKRASRCDTIALGLSKKEEDAKSRFFYRARFVRKLALCSRCYTLIPLEISHRTRWRCLKFGLVYLARVISAFVMHCIYGESRSSLLIESTYSMIHMYCYCLEYIAEIIITTKWLILVITFSHRLGSRVSESFHGGNLNVGLVLGFLHQSSTLFFFYSYFTVQFLPVACQFSGSKLCSI